MLTSRNLTLTYNFAITIDRQSLSHTVRLIVCDIHKWLVDSAYRR